LISIELTKQLRRARGWVTLGAVAAVAGLIAILIGATRGGVPERIGDWGSVTTDSSGFALPLVAVNALVVFLLPLTVAVSAGECVAGDASWGSLRYLLARPVSRSRVLGAKAVVAGGFSVASVVLAVSAPLVVGIVGFGWRPLTVIDLQHTTPFYLSATTITGVRALGLVAATSAFVLISLASTFSFAFLVSTLTDRAFSAVASGVGFCLVSRALDNIPGLHALSPWLPVTDASSSAWTGFFTKPEQWGPIGHTLIVQAVFSICFLTAAWVRFVRWDVLR
jgi:ABC-2 type transport system permease protein